MGTKTPHACMPRMSLRGIDFAIEFFDSRQLKWADVPADERKNCDVSFMH
jgi:hypothetical protein